MDIVLYPLQLETLTSLDQCPLLHSLLPLNSSSIFFHCPQIRHSARRDAFTIQPPLPNETFSLHAWALTLNWKVKPGRTLTA